MDRFRLAIAVAFAVSGSSIAGAIQANERESLPIPHLIFRGAEAYEANGFDFVRLQYEVTNKSSYSKAMFATSPGLSSCGQSAAPSRTAVAIYDITGKRMVEFCSLKGPGNLGQLWFAISNGTSPPKEVYIEITDRLTGESARSNVVTTSSAD